MTKSNEIPDVRKFVEEIAMKTSKENSGAVSIWGLKSAVEMFIGQRILEMSGVKLPKGVPQGNWVPEPRAEVKDREEEAWIGQSQASKCPPLDPNRSTDGSFGGITK